jgi:hypothetical protein
VVSRETCAVRPRAYWGFVLAVGWVGCGYAPAYGGERPAERLAVVAAPHQIPELEVVHATLSGTRAELSAAGVLAPGEAAPRVVVELVRVDERSSGVAATTLAGAELPLARGSTVGAVGRAWVEESAGGTGAARDTGDVRRVEHFATSGDPRIDAMRHSRALESAGRRLGRALARRVLGDPEPLDEAM